MQLEQFHLDSLSHASYLVTSDATGEALVVEPRRDVDVYLDAARAKGGTDLLRAAKTPLTIRQRTPTDGSAPSRTAGGARGDRSRRHPLENAAGPGRRELLCKCSSLGCRRLPGSWR